MPPALTPTDFITNPGRGDQEVAPTKKVTLSFKMPLDPATVNAQNILLRDGENGLVDTVVNYDEGTRTVTLTPNQPLHDSSRHEATVTTSLRSLAGESLEEPFTWDFTTADRTPPVVSSHEPPKDAEKVQRSAAVSATFSEPLLPASVSASAVTLADSNGSVDAEVDYIAEKRQVTLTPKKPLAEGTKYTVTVKGGDKGVKDLSGNPMGGDASWSFTTARSATPTTPVSQARLVMCLASAMYWEKYLVTYADKKQWWANFWAIGAAILAAITNVAIWQEFTDAGGLTAKIAGSVVTVLAGLCATIPRILNHGELAGAARTLRPQYGAMIGNLVDLIKIAPNFDREEAASVVHDFQLIKEKKDQLQDLSHKLLGEDGTDLTGVDDLEYAETRILKTADAVKSIEEALRRQ